MVTLANCLETMLNQADAEMNEKLEFLIFMQSKIVGEGKYTVTGNQLFQEWRKAKNTPAKPLPEEGEEKEG